MPFSVGCIKTSTLKGRNKCSSVLEYCFKEEFYFNEDVFLLTAKSREAAMASRTLRDFFEVGFLNKKMVKHSSSNGLFLLTRLNR